MDNLQLWDSVFKTDPDHVKPFQKGGGFKGSAIKPFYLVKKATDTFGPVGIGWGWEEVENKYIAGVWCSRVRLWYLAPVEDVLVEITRVSGHPDKVETEPAKQVRKGSIEQWGQTVMEGTNSKGAFVDEEAPKKAVTDAVTKCLSYLGFGGDVHMGLFDDSKYVDELRQDQYRQTSVFPNSSQRNKYLRDVYEHLEVAPTLVDLQANWTAAWSEKLKDMANSPDELDREGYLEAEKRKDKRKATLQAEHELNEGFDNATR